MTTASPRTTATAKAHPDRRTARTETIHAITHLVVMCRPDWDAALVRAVLYSHAEQVDANDLAIAALRAAANLDLPRPVAIGWRGPHWRDLATVPPQAERPPRCGVCGRPEPECWSVRPGKDDHQFEPVRAT